MAQSADKDFMSTFWKAVDVNYEIQPKKWYLKFQMWMRVKHDCDLKKHDDHLGTLKSNQEKKDYEAHANNAKQLFTARSALYIHLGDRAILELEKKYPDTDIIDLEYWQLEYWFQERFAQEFIWKMLHIM